MVFVIFLGCRLNMFLELGKTHPPSASQNLTQYFVYNEVTEGDHLGDLRVDGRTIL
jgi:hypothetical protein